MKKIGIVGGVAWPSTALYYSEICRRCEAGSAMPEMSVESLDLHKAVSYLGSDGNEESWSRFDEYHRAALRRLEASGVDFALIASNTPHDRFASIVRGIRIPVISIFEAAAREAARIGARHVLILGTDVTMKSIRFREEFARHGIAACGPADDAARSGVVDLIAGLQLGKLGGAADQLRNIAASSAATVVCLACTELPLAFPEHQTLATFEHGGIRYLNTVAIHIDAALRFAQNEV